MSSDLASTVRSLLRAAPSGVYLNTSAEGLPLRAHERALARYLDAKARGSRGRSVLAGIEAEARTAFAGLVGAEPHDVAFVSSTSRGLAIAIASVDWQPGDVLLTADTEFPSTLFSGELLASRGVELRVVRARDGLITIEDLIDAVDERVRLAALSMVSFKTGQILDFDRLVPRLREVGALLFVDAVQAVGAIPVAVGSADFLCAATFKWLLGVHGVAGFYASARARELGQVPYVGYRGVANLFQPGPFRLYADARRYDEGMPNFGALACLLESTEFINEIGLGAISAHNRRLTAQLRDGLDALGIEPLFRGDVADQSSIVSFSAADAEDVARQFGERDTEVWARDGRVRVSVHAYNTAEDIDAFLEQLADLEVRQA